MNARNLSHIGKNIPKIENYLKYRFRNKTLLQNALTHKGVSNDPSRNYERYEFLGDRVLALAVSDILMCKYPNSNEGDLHTMLRTLVSRETCFQISKKLKLDKFLETNKNYLNYKEKNLIADVCESVIGAIYIDGGFSSAKKFIETHWTEKFNGINNVPLDFKTKLQDWSLKKELGLPKYFLVQKIGPDHSPIFTVKVSIKTKDSYIGKGISKQEAEQSAAKNFLLKNKISN